MTSGANATVSKMPANGSSHGHDSAAPSSPAASAASGDSIATATKAMRRGCMTAGTLPRARADSIMAMTITCPSRTGVTLGHSSLRESFDHAADARLYPRRREHEPVPHHLHFRPARHDGGRQICRGTWRLPRPGHPMFREPEIRARRGRRHVRACGKGHQLFCRHGAPADLLRGARPLRRHRGAAGLDRHPNLEAGARGRVVRDRGDRRGAAEITSENQTRGNMMIMQRDFFARTAVAAGGIGLALTLAAGTVSAQDKIYTLKITLPTLNDPSYFFAKNYAAALEKDSGGRIKPEIYPASQLGTIPRQIEGVQFGAIQCALIPPEFFVGVDERFEVLAAPGLVDSMDHGQRLVADPATRKTILALGADKGLHGVAFFMNAPSSIIAKAPIRHLADFKGKKLRVLASALQTEPFNRLGATPVVMTLGDVLPALQQGTLDGSVGSVVVFTPMHFQEAAKFLTETGQPPVFVAVEISKRWYDALPTDLQKIVDDDAAKESVALHPHMVELYNKARNGWTDAGGELISLPPDEQKLMIDTLSTVGADLSIANPTLSETYKAVAAAAERTR